MTGFTTITRDDIRIFISDEYKELHTAILTTFADNVNTVVNDSNIPCKERKHNGIKCMTLFEGMLANSLLGNRKTAAVLFNLIIETLKQEKTQSVYDITPMDVSVVSDNDNIVYWTDSTNEY